MPLTMYRVNTNQPNYGTVTTYRQHSEATIIPPLLLVLSPNHAPLTAASFSWLATNSPKPGEPKGCFSKSSSGGINGLHQTRAGVGGSGVKSSSASVMEIRLLLCNARGATLFQFFVNVRSETPLYPPSSRGTSTKLKRCPFDGIVKCKIGVHPTFLRSRITQQQQQLHLGTTQLSLAGGCTASPSTLKMITTRHTSLMGEEVAHDK